jgi:hypothetical protein
MKTTLLLSLLIISGFSQNLHAMGMATIADNRSSILDETSILCGKSAMSSTNCVISSITSLPTFFIAATEELNPQERYELLRGEAQKLVDGMTTESIYIQLIADESGKSVMEVAKEIMKEN